MQKICYRILYKVYTKFNTEYIVENKIAYCMILYENLPEMRIIQNLLKIFRLDYD